MFYDLDVGVPPEARGKAIQTLTRLGYDVAAFTTTVSNVKKLTAEHLPKRDRPDPDDDKSSKKIAQFHTDPRKRKKGLTVLERVTLVIESNDQLGLLSAPGLSAFDLVAVRPGNEKLLQQCLQFDVDIVSLSLGRRQGFQVKRPQVHVAAEKGVVFEICYATGLRDATARRFLVSNGGSLCRATGGRHVILSSGARTVMELRGPHDVMNLGVLFDLDGERGRGAVTRVAEDCVARGDVRSRMHKGIVRVEPAAERQDEDVEMR